MPDTHLFLPIILRNLNTVWEKVQHLGKPVVFPAKAIVSGETAGDDPKQGMYYIKRGLVRLTSLSPGGQERTMLYLGPGVFFREIPMLLHSGDSVFTCMESTETVFFPKKMLTCDFIKTHPELFLNLVESLSRKSMCFYNQLSGACLYGSFGNTCRALYSMYLFNRQKGHVYPGLTQLELAAFLGIHRSSLHKALARLKDEGIVGAYSRKHLAVYNPEALYGYALKAEDE